MADIDVFEINEAFASQVSSEPDVDGVFFAVLLPAQRFYLFV